MGTSAPAFDIAKPTVIRRWWPLLAALLIAAAIGVVVLAGGSAPVLSAPVVPDRDRLLAEPS